MKKTNAPTRKNIRAENMDKATGLKTPANVPKVLVSDGSEIEPNSTYPWEVFLVLLLEEKNPEICLYIRFVTNGTLSEVGVSVFVEPSAGANIF